VVPSVKDERAPVSGGAVLRLEAEVREVAAVQCWSGEGESRRGGERTRPAVVRFPFKGGPVGWQRRGVWWSTADAWRKWGRARAGGLGAVWGSGAASGGSGPAVARADDALPCDSGGQRGLGDAGRRG
jgi:hypothetical protein